MTMLRNPVSRLIWPALGALLLLAACAVSAPVAAAQTSKSPVDVNSADAATLQSLPGIGPTLAQRIIEGRPYQSLADLEKVKGLSKAKVDSFKDQVTFGPPAAAKTAKSAKSAKAAETATTTKPAVTKPENQTAGAAEPKTAPQAAATSAQPKGTKSGQATPSPTGQPSGRLASGQKVNINNATVEQLDALPGIGPAKAQAIVDYRTQNGPFKTVEDIQKVKGIKAGEFSKIKDQITVGD